MIRLIILALGIFLIWVLFASSFERQRKILISVLVALVALLGLWWETGTDTPRVGLISNQQIEVCGLQAKHAYRTNFDVDFCLRNNSEDAVVKRVAAKFIAQRCEADDTCQQVQSFTRDIALIIEPLSDVDYTENFSFDQVKPEDASVSWAIEIEEVKAINAE